MLARVLLLVSIVLSAAMPSTAQNRSSLESPTCMMWQDAPLYGRLLDNDAYTHELFIWYWHVYGFEEVRRMSNWVNQQDRFAACFDRKTRDNCGFKADGAIRKALEKNRSDEFDKNPLKKLYTERPPAAAVEFAMKSLGTCFGDDPALPTLARLGLTAGKFETNACMHLATEMIHRPEKLPAELAARRGWGVALQKYFTKPGVYTLGKACAVVPTAAVSFLDDYVEKYVRSRERDQITWDNRSVAQRIAGLDAYGIAYSLVYRTVAREHTPSRPLPQGASQWALDYAAKVADGYPEPAIPDAVREWALAQPLDKFEAMEDPFAERMRLRTNEITPSLWARHVQTRLNKVAPNEERIAVTEGCSILWGIAHGDVNFDRRSPQTRGEEEFYRLLKQTPDQRAQIMCNETPVGIFTDAKARYAKRLEEQAYAAANPPQPSEWDDINRRLREYANRPNPNSAPYKAPTTRCYDTGTTQSGLTNRVCFTN